MQSTITLHPGCEQPIRFPRSAQLAAIRSRAKASEAVVNLLCELAYGPRPDWWPPVACKAYAEAAHG